MIYENGNVTTVQRKGRSQMVYIFQRSQCTEKDVKYYTFKIERRERMKCYCEIRVT